MITRLLLSQSIIVLALLSGPLACAQGTAFSYQGFLTDSGAPANSSYDLTFSLFNSDHGSSQLGNTVTNSAVAVSNGVFTVLLDFGAGNFSGADRWLEIGVRTNGGGEFVTLNPRQKLSASPYAITAGNLTGVVPGTGISGTYSSAVAFENPANSFAGNGSAITGLDAANISNGVVPLVRGGTGADTASGARVSLGAAASGANSDITSLSGLSAPLSIGQGGTGAGTPSGALLNLQGASLTGSNTFTGVNVFSNTANGFLGRFTGDGSELINLSAASLTGALPSSQLAGTYSGSVIFNNPTDLFSGTFHGDGSALTGLNASSFASGVVSVDHGGTGADTGAGARASLGAAAWGANSDITSLSGLSTPLSIGQGGTGAGTSSAARGTLGAAASGANSDITSLSGLTTPLSIGQGGTGASTPSSGLLNLGGASLTAANTFSGVNVLSNAANDFVGSFVGDGSGLVSINASTLTGTLPGAQLVGTYSGSVTFNNPADSFLGAFTGNGSGVSNVNATTLAGFSASGFWQVGGNAGTTASANFLGTTDNQPLQLKAAGGVGINTNNPAGKALAINGSVGISATNTLEFGSDVTGKQPNAGKIGYQTLTPGSLDIVGAGTNTTSRKIKFWTEGGATFNGTGTNALLTINNTVDEQTSMFFAAPFSTWRVGQNKPPDAPGAFDSFFIYQQNAGATRLLITTDGRVGLGTNNPIFPLHLGNGAYCTAGGQWTSVSDRNAKEDFKAIRPRDVLAKVVALPIAEWRYKVEANGVRHLGPTAQDFHAAFGLGESDRAIGSVDADGVALAAIQGLNQKLEENQAALKQQLEMQSDQLKTKQARIESLEQTVAELRQIVLEIQQAESIAGR